VNKIFSIVSNRRRARDSLRRGETRATLTAVNKFLEVWHQASAEDNDNNDQCLLLLRHCSNLREYFDSTRQSLLEETKSLAERYAIY
jgi:hypothetical protein